MKYTTAPITQDEMRSLNKLDKVTQKRLYKEWLIAARRNDKKERQRIQSRIYYKKHRKRICELNRGYYMKKKRFQCCIEVKLK